MLGARSAVAGLLALLAAAAPAFAAKTDKVTLVNGDAFTCEIKELSRGKLVVSTDDAGTLSVEWTKVATVTTLRPIEVEARNGTRVVGMISSPGPGRLTVTVPILGSLEFDLIDIVFLAPIEDGFFKRIDGSVSAGASYTQSSGVLQANLAFDATYRKPSAQYSMAFSSYLTKESDGEDTSRSTLQFEYQRPFRARWGIVMQGGFERNKDLGFLLRSTGGGGIGHAFVKSNRAELVTAAGLSTSREVPLEGDTTQSLDLLLVVRQSYFLYDFPKTDITLSLDAFPGLSQWGRFRLSFDGTAKREIFRDFTIGITAYDSYDNRPPNGSTRTNDVGFSINLGYTF